MEALRSDYPPARSTTVKLLLTEKAERAVEALVADWKRQEGTLRRAQAERLILKRRLSIDEGVAIFQELARRGIELEGRNTSRSPAEDDEAKSEQRRQADSEDFVPGYFMQRLLSHREEIELGRAIQLGGLARVEIESGLGNQDLREMVAQGDHARNRLVQSNLRLVFSQAQKHAGHSYLEVGDLVQEGTIGLMRAAELFDPDFGLKFSTYATHWINQAILRGIDNSGLVRVPVHRLESIRNLRRMRRALSIELGRVASVRELADALEWEPEKVAYVEALSVLQIVPLDTPISRDGEHTLADIMESPLPTPEELCFQSERSLVVEKLLSALQPRQKEVLVRRFGLVADNDETLQEIGDDLAVTRERIRQIEARALERIKKLAVVSGAKKVL